LQSAANSTRIPEPGSAKGLRFGLVVSRFNDEVTSRLRTAAVETLCGLGAAESAIELFEVPGAFEIPFAASEAAQLGRFDAIVCLGCVIRGETPHFDYICQWAAHGVGQVGLQSGLPVIFGVLTTDTLEQAVARSSAGPTNKGAEAALSAVEMASLVRHLRP
jgi:6,7-dimethyl-8-ribityllumazine synthase